MQYCGYKFPKADITVNMAPADLKKEGSGFDLPLAIALLAAHGNIESDKLPNYMLVGELGLDGKLQPIKGALPIAIKARAEKFKGLIVPKDNVKEAAVVNNLDVYGMENMLDVVKFLTGMEDYSPTVIDTRKEFYEQQYNFDFDFSDVRGQENVKRALEVAAAGGHNLIMVGPPGSGKSMMAKRLPSILPPLSLSESLETTQIHSIAGKLGCDTSLISQRPFRSPHHTISEVALVGGGTNPMPGEISLAHNGVLFLDELPEFDRRVLDSLREPLETGAISICRAARQVDFPARFQLIGAMNPSPCGHVDDAQQRSSPQQVLRYLGKLSGPFLDRFDLTVEIPLLPKGALSGPSERGESSESIRQRVVHTRQLQLQRAGKLNALLDSRELEQYCALSSRDAQFLEEVIHQLGLSLRAWHKILRVARTLADMAQETAIQRHHLAEALGYRAMDRLLKRLRAS
jgi:magnesium chelatase family protein